MTQEQYTVSGPQEQRFIKNVWKGLFKFMLTYANNFHGTGSTEFHRIFIECKTNTRFRAETYSKTFKWQGKYCMFALLNSRDISGVQSVFTTGLDTWGHQIVKTVCYNSFFSGAGLRQTCWLKNISLEKTDSDADCIVSRCFVFVDTATVCEC